MKSSLKKAKAKYEASKKRDGWSTWHARVSPETRELITQQKELRGVTYDELLNRAMRLLSNTLE